MEESEEVKGIGRRTESGKIKEVIGQRREGIV